MIPKIKKGVRSRPEEFGALIFTNRTPILALNEDSASIWNLVDGKRTVAEIIGTISGTRTDDEDISSLVNEFIFSCIDLGLIEAENLAPPQNEG